MTWYEFLLALIGAGGIGGLIATIANVIQARRKSVSEQRGSAIEQTKDTVNLVDELLKKQLNWMSDRMDQGEAVRKKEFEELRTDIGNKMLDIQTENSKQNGLLSDIVEYLNGDFQEFERKKHKKKKKKV